VATFSTKTGLSIVAVTGLFSLRDELPDYRRRVLEMSSAKTLAEIQLRRIQFNPSIVASFSSII